MFATAYHRLNQRRDFADTCAFASSAAARLPHPADPLPDALDAVEQIAHADAADRALLQLVGCAASATLLLAVASSVGGW